MQKSRTTDPSHEIKLLPYIPGGEGEEKQPLLLSWPILRTEYGQTSMRTVWRLCGLPIERDGVFLF